MVSLCMIIIDGISVHLGVMASLGASQLKKIGLLVQWIFSA